MATSTHPATSATAMSSTPDVNEMVELKNVQAEGGVTPTAAIDSDMKVGDDSDSKAAADADVKVAQAEGDDDLKTKRGLRFWLVYVALCLSVLLAALDLVRRKTVLTNRVPYGIRLIDPRHRHR